MDWRKRRVNAMARPDNSGMQARIAALNAELLRAANDNRWDAVAPLLEQREKLLPTVPTAQRQQLLEASHRVTREVLQLARRARQGLSEQLSGLKKGRAATDSYAAGQRDIYLVERSRI